MMDASQRYATDVMPSVPGWFYPHDALMFRAIDAIQRAGNLRGNLVEVGVYCGKSLGLMATFRRDGEMVFGFDLFTGAASAAKTREVIQNAVGTNSFTHLVTANSRVMEAADIRRIVGDPVRFMHIDAGHEYADVLNDMRKFAPLLHDGGVLAMDDYYDRDFPGVCAATVDFTRESQLVPLAAASVKLFLCHRSNHREYLKALLSIAELAQQSHLALFRDEPMMIAFSSKHEMLKNTHQL